MPKSVSGDLHERVIEAVEAAASRREVAERFEISASSAVKWLQRWRHHGVRAPKPRGGVGSFRVGASALNDGPVVHEELRPCVLIEFAKTGLRRRCGDQLDDDLMADERFSAPVFGDEREQTMLGLVPLAGTGRQVTHGDRNTEFVGEFLKLPLPQTHA
jgi:hypothetical protein